MKRNRADLQTPENRTRRLTECPRRLIYSMKMRLLGLMTPVASGCHVICANI